LFSVIGVARKKRGLKEFEKHLYDGVGKFSRRGKPNKKEWANFIKQLIYYRGEFNAVSTYTGLDKQIKKLEKEWKMPANVVFYLAVPPNSFEEIALHIGNSG